MLEHHAAALQAVSTASKTAPDATDAIVRDVCALQVCTQVNCTSDTHAVLIGFTSRTRLLQARAAAADEAARW